MKKKPKFRYLLEGERLKLSDVARHKCGCYYYETRDGIKRGGCHPVDEYCAKWKCYKRRDSQ